jgi:hypothetical protein
MGRGPLAWDLGRAAGRQGGEIFLTAPVAKVERSDAKATGARHSLARISSDPAAQPARFSGARKAIRGAERASSEEQRGAAGQAGGNVVKRLRDDLASRAAGRLRVSKGKTR